jgi:hypothetical protein
MFDDYEKIIILSTDSMHIGVLATAAHAASSGGSFTIYIYLSNFIKRNQAFQHYPPHAVVSSRCNTHIYYMPFIEE